MVDANFRTCVYAVLSLPQLNEPGAAVVVKIYWLAVKNQLDMGGYPIIEGTIAEISLPGIQAGGKQILPEGIGKAKGSNQFIQLLRLFAAGEGADLFAYAFRPVMVYQGKNQKNR